MINYFLDQEAYALLNEWVESNRTRTIYAPYFSKKSSLTLKGDDYTGLKMMIEATSYGYKFNLLKNELIAKGKLTVCDTCKNDFSIVLNFTNENLNECDKFVLSQKIKVFLTAFISANAFMWFGNFSSEKKIITRSSSDRVKNKNITFRKFKESLYAVEFKPHRSPEGVFSVRGHFRRYKDGKIIWIDEYLKGQRASTRLNEKELQRMGYDIKNCDEYNSCF